MRAKTSSFLAKCGAMPAVPEVRASGEVVAEEELVCRVVAEIEGVGVGKEGEKVEELEGRAEGEESEEESPRVLVLLGTEVSMVHWSQMDSPHMPTPSVGRTRFVSPRFWRLRPRCHVR